MHVEMASREFAELEVIEAIAQRMNVAVGVIDVKSYYIETPEDVDESHAQMPAVASAGPTSVRARLRSQPDGTVGGEPKTRRTGRRRAMRANGNRGFMIQPAVKDEALLADIRTASRNDHHFRLWWLGQSGFLLQWKGEHLLFDPYLSDSLTRKYANTDKPHVRMTELVIDPARLTFVRRLTSSHNHTDHLDAETLGPLRHANPDMTIVIAEANRDFVATRLRIDRETLVAIAIGAHVDVGPFRIEAVPAAHEELDAQFVGYVVRCGAWTLYHSGDTMRFDGMVDVLRPHAVDVALLPINGRAPERRVAGNLDTAAAAELARDIGARVAIPCHYEMFAFNTADPATFVHACRAVGQRGDVLRCGEQWASTSL